MAEREGFEPSIRFKTYTPLAGERLQPLGHLSGVTFLSQTWSDGAPGRIRTSDRLVRSQVLYPTELRARNSKAVKYGLCIPHRQHRWGLFTDFIRLKASYPNISLIFGSQLCLSFAQGLATNLLSNRY